MNKPRILIINPNSSAEMTEAIHKNAVAFAGEDMEITTVPTPGAPPFIGTYENHFMTTPSMVQILREREKDYDAIIVACHSDPNLDLMKELAHKPVVGISETSMKMANQLCVGIFVGS